MSEKLSEENRALLTGELAVLKFDVMTSDGPQNYYEMPESTLNRLLNSARAEARPAPVVDREAVAKVAGYLRERDEAHGFASDYANDAERMTSATEIVAFLQEEARPAPAVDREAVARELWNLATGCEPGEAWAWEKAIWIAAFWPEAFSCRDLVSKCFQATDAILALLSPATSPEEEKP